MVNKQKTYSLQELERLLYGTANTFHGSGNLSNLEILNVAIPTLFFKRILDLRQDYIENNLFKNNKHYTYSHKDPLKALKGSKPKINDAFLTIHDNEWFFITFQDIINFQDNPKEQELTIPLHIDNNLTIKTSAKNRIKFLEEIYNSFEHKTIKDIFKNSRYFTLYLNDKLDYNESNILINKFANDHFGENIKTDLFSQAYIYLISVFASSAGKKGGEFFTPDPICKAVVACLNPELKQHGGRTKVCDITSGSSTFLIEFGNYIQEAHQEQNIKDQIEFYLQEKENQTLILGEAGLILAGFEHLYAFHGNTLLSYQDKIGQYRNKMDYFVGNPPYGTKILQQSDYEKIKELKNEKRWDYGMPPRAELEWFFVQSALDMTHEKGQGGLILPLGTLFKNNTRQKMIEDDIVEGIITLPDDMFQTTGIPICIWIFNKNKKDQDKNKIFMINNSEEYIRQGKYNTINYNKLISTYQNRKTIEGFSRYVNKKEVENNQYNLSVQHYVFKEEQKKEIDILALNQQSIELDKKIAEKQQEMNSIFDMVADIQREKQ